MGTDSREGFGVGRNGPCVKPSRPGSWSKWVEGNGRVTMRGPYRVSCVRCEWWCRRKKVRGEAGVVGRGKEVLESSRS